MKIVHAVYSLDMGGAEMIVGQLCRVQRAAGHDVSVFAYSRYGVIGESLLAEGFSIHVAGEAHPLVTMLRYFRLFRTQKQDVVHCHNVAATIHAAAAARLAGVRRVISTRHRLELHPYDWMAEVKYNVMGWFCDWVTGICEVTCENIRRGPLAPREKTVRVYNGTLAVERVSIAGLGKAGFTLVFIGRLVREKDLGTLLRAVALASSRVAGLQLWIVGDGPERATLEGLAYELGIGGQVRFWGQQMDTARFFSAADVFVMSSISEGLPMSLLQAMSLGTPAIVTDVDGMGEVLRLTGGGLLVPVSDPEAMANAIVRMAGDKELRERLSRRASEGYFAGFTLETMNSAYMELYRS